MTTNHETRSTFDTSCILEKLALYSSDEESSPRDVDVNNLSRYAFPGNIQLPHADCSVVESDGMPLRVVSYNIHGWRDTDHIDNLDRIIELLSDVKVEVVVLQVCCNFSLL